MKPKIEHEQQQNELNIRYLLYVYYTLHDVTTESTAFTKFDTVAW